MEELKNHLTQSREAQRKIFWKCKTRSSSKHERWKKKWDWRCKIGEIKESASFSWLHLPILTIRQPQYILIHEARATNNMWNERMLTLAFFFCFCRRTQWNMQYAPSAFRFVLGGERSSAKPELGRVLLAYIFFQFVVFVVFVNHQKNRKFSHTRLR